MDNIGINRPLRVEPNNLYNIYPHSYVNSVSSNTPLDKITAIIQSWNIKFDGSATGLSVEEFLYRVTSLTNYNFNGDFTAICKNLNSLLVGKAKEWHWWHHRQSPSPTWNDFCTAIRAQFKEFKTTYDIKEELRNRKQKQNENFDSFREAVSCIMDRLSIPIADEEL